MTYLIRLYRFLFKPCPRQVMGYKCHAYSAQYGYVCDECGKKLQSVEL